MIEHKDPHQRQHLFERPPRPDELPKDETPVDHEYPRHVHKSSTESRIVKDAKEEAVAKRDGYKRDVPLTTEQKQAVADAQARAEE